MAGRMEALATSSDAGALLGSASASKAEPSRHAEHWASPTRRRALLGGALLGGCRRRR